MELSEIFTNINIQNYFFSHSCAKSTTFSRDEITRERTITELSPNGSALNWYISAKCGQCQIEKVKRVVYYYVHLNCVLIHYFFTLGMEFC